MRKRYNVKNVEEKVMKAISKYCKERAISQAYYLETDRRIKDLLG